MTAAVDAPLTFTFAQGLACRVVRVLDPVARGLAWLASRFTPVTDAGVFYYPALLLRDVDQLRGANLGSLVLAASAYVLVRFLEAFGLWHERAWGEWLGAPSGALYVPFEFRHLLHHPTIATALVMTANIAVVGFLAWELRQRRPPPPA